MSNLLNVIIADDHKLYRDGLELVLQSNVLIGTIKHASNGIEVMQLLEEEPFHLIFMDISMPQMDGLATTKLIGKKYKSTKVIVLSMHQDKKNIYDLYDAGAAAYLLKSSPVEDINKAIAEVSQGKSYYVPEVSELIINRFKEKQKIEKETAELTKREKNILKLICKQYSNQEIADKLFISARTVESYRENLLRKTNSRNTAGLVVFAHKNQLFN